MEAYLDSSAATASAAAATTTSTSPGCNIQALGSLWLAETWQYLLAEALVLQQHVLELTGRRSGVRRGCRATAYY